MFGYQILSDNIARRTVKQDFHVYRIIELLNCRMIKFSIIFTHNVMYIQRKSPNKNMFLRIKYIWKFKEQFERQLFLIILALNLHGPKNTSS